MKIYDCFMFFNELELLELRLMTLNDIVDYFVLSEANKTHTGGKKDFIFEQNRDKFAQYLDKIIYVKVEDLPDYSQGMWVPENFQRNVLSRGLVTAQEGDRIIVSDVDEIPNPEMVELAVTTFSGWIGLQQHLFYYYVNCMQNQPWEGPVIAPYGSYDCLQDLRNSRCGVNRLPNGGWHYSFMGGAQKIREKVENIAESSVIIAGCGTVEEIERKMLTQADLWNRTEYFAQKKIVDITQEGMAPKCIWEFIEKHPEYYFKGADVAEKS